jgi:LacI family transcriptional regulator
MKSRLNTDRTVAKTDAPRLPTMRDVAILAGVHQTTVSLALRNDPEIPVKTRERIRAFAEKIGYHPDPVLDAFNFHRLANHPLRSAPAIAFISDLASGAAFEESAARRDLYFGARETAGRMGFVFERFFVGPQNLSPSRLNGILESRNIDCAIVASFSLQTRELPLDWMRLCALKVESFHVQPQLDIITADHVQASRLALSQLWSLGFRRIGMALTHSEDVRLAKLSRAGYLVELAGRTESVPIAPLYIDGVAPQNLPGHLAMWINKNRIEAVISDSSHLLASMRRAGYAIPGDLGFASLDWARTDEGLAGVEANHYLIGQSAVELLAMRRHTNERGVREEISITFVPGSWHDGPTTSRPRLVRHAEISTPLQEPMLPADPSR